MKRGVLSIVCMVILVLSLGKALAQERIYQGTATTTIAVLHPLSGAVIEQQTFTKAIQVIVGLPARGESNRINLVIVPTPSEPTVFNEEGQFSLYSAVEFIGRGQSFLAQYWDLNLTGSTLTGVLTNTHVAEALALNLINSVDLNLLFAGLRSVTSLPMERQVTMLNGTLTERQAQLQLEGHTTDLAHAFVSTISAVRVN